MPKRGPKTHPAAVRTVRGSRQRARHQGSPPGPPAAPEPPDWLPLAAQQLWLALLTSGVQAEQTVLERYCVARLRWQGAVQQLQGEGSVLEAASGYRYANPRTKELKDLAAEMEQLEARLTRVQPEQQAKARFFGGP